ncbi:MAG: hypothetical protein RE469_04420 [Cuniculiplasma divulgatum]|jgi:hypothetical protein|nr:MAG: hypothetical protein RE469_04420 [Cuniculiplasma divulgatum]
MIQLYKYSFKFILYLNSSKDDILFDIDFSNPRKHNGRKGAYVTPDKLNSNFYVRYKLSLTYVPNYVSELDQKLLMPLIKNEQLRVLNNKQQDITPSFITNQDNFDRVWPSFGSYGGAREAFLCFDQNIKLGFGKINSFSIPGNMDFYHSDDDENIALDLIGLLVEIAELYPHGENYPGRENGQVKRAGKNMSINVTYSGHINITASIAYNDSTHSAYLKCWLNVWADFQTSMKREIYFSQSAEYLFEKIGLNELCQQKNLARNLFFPLFEELKSYIPRINAHLSSIYEVKLT